MKASGREHRNLVSGNIRLRKANPYMTASIAYDHTCEQSLVPRQPQTEHHGIRRLSSSTWKQMLSAFNRIFCLLIFRLLKDQ